MDSEIKLYRSLPPLVEGKIHGYLKLCIDEIIWYKNCPGDIIVFASWWGEQDSAHFRPADITTNEKKLDHNISEIYCIRTNKSLFEEYIKNCEIIELVIISKSTHEIVGQSEVKELPSMFESKPYFKHFPILNNSGNRIGEIHVSIKLFNIAKTLSMQFRTHKYQKKQVEDDIVFSSINSNLPYRETKLLKQNELKNYRDNKLNGVIKTEETDTFKTILKSKKIEFDKPLQKFSTEITDKLVAQVVARAQRLRGAILKETYDDDPLALSDDSLNDKFQYGTSVEDEAKLYEYFLGNEMSVSDERKALNMLRTASPTPSLIDLASEVISDHDNTQIHKVNSMIKKGLSADSFCNKLNDTSLLDRVDSIRIFLESFSLNSAGYRRLKSCLSCKNCPLSVTYFVKYNTTFGCFEQVNYKLVKNCKPVKMSSQEQPGQIIQFDHEGMYNISKFHVNTNIAINFKLLVRHLSKKSPIELGSGLIYISNITKTENLSLTQRLPIINKGIKIGELKVTTELGCDLTHFGEQYIDAIMPGKENISTLDAYSVISKNIDKCKTATGMQSKTSSSDSCVSAKKVNCSNSDTNSDLLVTRDISEHKEQSVDDKKVDLQISEVNVKDKILLHGLIYVAEGKDLPELNTFLICRAFWREDKVTSQVCHDTKNPFYHFCQLVPLIHGNELLERIKDNYIIVEVHKKNSIGTDDLLGIAKLPIHQLYVAYRDPLILSHLLSSKYPVISIDGWISINNPVTGQSCGQLLALVALGTAEQIALLEMSRGLRTQIAMSQTVRNYSHNCFDDTKYVQNFKGTCKINSNEQHSKPPSGKNTCHVADVSNSNNITFMNLKTQECQTDVSTIKKSTFLSNEQTHEDLNSDQLVLHNLVNRLTHALNTTKTINQAAQTETELNERRQIDTERHLCMNSLNCSVSDDSSSNSSTNNVQLPTETYRSGGVGAEIDEPINGGSAIIKNNTYYLSDMETIQKKDICNTFNNSVFKAIIEIESALHLPKVKDINELVKPSTYVTFQKSYGYCKNQLHSSIKTNIFPYSCDPKWNWKCEMTLPVELLTRDEKRLILKIWRLIDPDTNMEINMEKDIVIGFAAIDLSVLTAGFPIVSGWFHIIDFNSKCNGQIKVSVTPLDNLSTFVTSFMMTQTTQEPVYSSPQSCKSLSYNHDMYFDNLEPSNTLYINTCPKDDECLSSESQVNHLKVDGIQNSEDTSMSFLSLSLKQKLTELDEITKRLQLRLHDVTNTAFEDFETDFDFHEPNNDNDNFGNIGIDDAPPASNASCMNAILQTSKICNPSYEKDDKRYDDYNLSFSNHQYNKSQGMNSNVINNSSSINSNFHSNLNIINDYYPKQQHCEYHLQNNNTCNTNDYPARGTKMHISHLLDKLSLELPARSYVNENMQLKKNIDLLSGKSQNVQEVIKIDDEMNVHTKPVQKYENKSFETSQKHAEINTDSTNYLNNSEDFSETCTKSQSLNKISAVIREELIAEEITDSPKYDELTTYLITSNVRHMDLDNVFNPLLYQHFVPDLHISNTVSPETEAVEQLDNRYSKSFGSAINVELPKKRKLNETNNLTKEEKTCNENQRNTFESLENIEAFRFTPSGVSEIIDGNIDFNVTQKPSSTDLMATNSTESSTTISFGKSIKQCEIEIDENSYSNLSEISVSATSRQAPDGGNPVDENCKTLFKIQQNDSQDSSSSS